jgi:hypothetical protein
LNNTVTFDFNLSFNALNLIILLLLSFLLVLLGHLKFFVSMRKARRSPPYHCPLQLLFLEHTPEVIAHSLSLIIKVLLAGSHSDSAEHFNSQSASSDGANHVASVFLSFHVLSPGD